MSKRRKGARRPKQRAARPLPAPGGAGASAELPLPAWAPAAWLGRRWQPEVHLPLLALLLLVALVYWPAYFAGFIWDDNIFYDAKQVRDWSGLADLWLDLGSVGSESHYWPLLYTSLWLDHKIWGGFNPTGFHVTNVLLHCAVTGLLWRLLARMGLPGAWLVAALFALHPMKVETVAWVIARKDLLASLFYLLAVGRWLRFRETGQPRAYLALLAFYVLALLSKTLAITLPAALLVWVWWREGRIAQRDLAQLAPLFLIGAGFGWYGLAFFTGRTLIEFEYSLAERLIIAGKALWFYAGKLLWPHPLQYIYNLWDTDPARLLNWLPLAGALALALGLWLARGRIGRGPLAGALFFAITLSPMLGFADNSYMKFAFVADRYQYLASAGALAVLVAAAASGWAWLAGRTHAGTEASAALPFLPRGPLGYGAGTLAALLLLGWGLMTMQRAQLFQDKVVLFQDVVARTPAAYEAYYNLGTFLMERQRAEEAVEAFQEGLKYEPHRIKMYVNLSSALMDLDRHEEAEALLRQAIAREPERFEQMPDPHGARYEAAGVHTNLGMVLMDLDRLPEAEAALARALQLDPKMMQAERNLVALLLRQERHEEALAALERIAKREPSAPLYMQMADVASQAGRTGAAQRYEAAALALAPDDLGSLAQQAAALFNAGRFAAALEVYQRLVAQEPGSPPHHANRGLALAQLGRLAEAEQSLEKALALDPEYHLALDQFASILYSQGRALLAEGRPAEARQRHEAALRLYQRSAALAPDRAGAHTHLGLALQQLGRLPEAAQSLARALALDPQHTAALAQLGALHFKARRFDKALELFRRQVALAPDNPEAHSNLGSALAQSGRMAEAIASFERALALDPESDSARNNLRLARDRLNPAP